MTIRRQYSLPNCRLTLECLSDGAANVLDSRPVVSILMSAECYFEGHTQPLTGGRDFFENLVRAVAQYAQEFLSGVTSPLSPNHQPPWVRFHRIEENLHRLTVQYETPPEPISVAESKPGTQFDLTTVQLFDLVEAVDQFLADSQTMPEIAVQLMPLSRRLARSGEPIAKQVVPAMVGVSSLALVALAFFFAPIPEVQRPKDPTPQTQDTSGEPSPASSAGSPNPKAATLPPTGNGSPSASPTSNPASSSTTTNRLEPSLTTPPITNPKDVEQLQQKLYDEINRAWKTQTFNEDLVFHVSVASDGAIVGYKPINPAAFTGVDKTPLPQLLYKPVGGQTVTEPLADFKVVFNHNTLEVTPWK